MVGASSGAAFGAALVIVTGWAGPTSAIGPASSGAFLGALGAVGLVYLVATAGNVPPVNLLLAGAAVSTMLGGLVWLVAAVLRDAAGSVDDDAVEVGRGETHPDVDVLADGGHARA